MIPRSSSPIPEPLSPPSSFDERWRAPIDRAALWLSVALVVLFFGLPLFEGLGNTDLKGDEPIYSFAVDRMLENGDWLTPRSIPSTETPFLEKPPLKFWIVAGAIRAGLVPGNEFGHRFADAAFGLAAFLYVFALGRVVAGPICGLVAVLVLFVHRPLIFEHGFRSNNMEAALVLAYAAGIFHAVAWIEAPLAGWRRWVHPLAVGAWFVLGFMTKFVAAIFLPAILFVTAALVPAWRRRVLADWRPWAASIALVLAACSPWFVYQHLKHGREFWDTILGVHVFQRFTAYLDPAHLEPWHFYISAMYQEMSGSRLVWGETSILVIAGLAYLIARTVRERWAVGVLLIVWIALPLAALSASTSKLYHYVYPFLPPLAIAAGLLPAAILNPDGIARARLRALLERAGRTLPGRVLQRAPAAWRWLAVALAVAALGIAAATAIAGPLRLSAAGVTLFRNSSTVRPMIIGAVLLVLAGHARLVAGYLVVPMLVLAMPLTSYTAVRAELPRAKKELRLLAECIGEVQAAGARHGVYGHAGADMSWDYTYYFRRVGWEEGPAVDEDVLTRQLTIPAEQRPVVISRREYEPYRSRRPDIATVFTVSMDHGYVVLLPGPYGACARRVAVGRTAR